MEKITLDFSNCETCGDVYNEIISTFDFPEWCAKNLDGIWEFFEDDFVWENEPTLITIIGTQEMSKDLFAIFEKIKKKVFDDVTKAAPNVKFEIIS